MAWLFTPRQTTESSVLVGRLRTTHNVSWSVWKIDGEWFEGTIADPAAHTADYYFRTPVVISDSLYAELAVQDHIGGTLQHLEA